MHRIGFPHAIQPGSRTPTQARHEDAARIAASLADTSKLVELTEEEL